MDVTHAVHPIIELISLVIELIAIVIIVVAITYGLLKYAADTLAKKNAQDAYHQFKVRLGSGLLLGLEILVAADVIRTVALEPTLQNVSALGLLVLIRTFLSWALVVEVEGRWPWQKKSAPDAPKVE